MMSKKKKALLFLILGTLYVVCINRIKEQFQQSVRASDNRHHSGYYKQLSLLRIDQYKLGILGSKVRRHQHHCNFWVRRGGRLGNVIFQYVTSILVAKGYPELCVCTSMVKWLQTILVKQIYHYAPWLVFSLEAGLALGEAFRKHQPLPGGSGADQAADVQNGGNDSQEMEKYELDFALLEVFQNLNSSRRLCHEP